MSLQNAVLFLAGWLVLVTLHVWGLSQAEAMALPLPLVSLVNGSPALAQPSFLFTVLCDAVTMTQLRPPLPPTSVVSCASGTALAL